MQRGELGGCDVARLGRRRRSRKECSRKEEKEKKKRLKISIAEWMER
jgi:hypothetical protein